MCLLYVRTQNVSLICFFFFCHTGLVFFFFPILCFGFSSMKTCHSCWHTSPWTMNLNGNDGRKCGYMTLFEPGKDRLIWGCCIREETPGIYVFYFPYPVTYFHSRKFFVSLALTLSLWGLPGFNLLISLSRTCTLLIWLTFSKRGFLRFILFSSLPVPPTSHHLFATDHNPKACGWIHASHHPPPPCAGLFLPIKSDLNF